MKLIVGLGNPGPTYAGTRHNAGFMVLDALLARHPAAALRQRFGGELAEVTLGGQKALLLRPTKFMNLSGGPVAEAAGFYKIAAGADLLVLVDDYALPAGQIRLRERGGHGGHNGLRDIERALGSEAYPRLRIGIDPKPPEYDDLADWVLGKFTGEQLARLGPAIQRAAEAAECFVRDGLTTAMNRFNTKVAPGAGTAAPGGTGGPGGAGGAGGGGSRAGGAGGGGG